MIAAVRALLASRKFVLLLVGCIVAIGGRLGLRLDPEIIGMVLGLIAVGVGSIAYEDGQAKRATVIDGGALDGKMDGKTPEFPAWGSVSDSIGRGHLSPEASPDSPRLPGKTTIEWDLGEQPAAKDVTVAYPTKADVVAAMVEPEPAVRVVEAVL